MSPVAHFKGLRCCKQYTETWFVRKSLSLPFVASRLKWTTASSTALTAPCFADAAGNSWNSFAHVASLHSVNRIMDKNKGSTECSRRYSTAAPPSSQSGNPNASSTGSTGSSGVGAESASTPALSKKEKLKKAVKDYGATVIVFHVIMSLGSLGFFYTLVSSGLDVASFLENMGVDKAVLESKITQGASTFVVAYAVHKVFAPVRVTITLTTIPFLVRYLRRVGILKPQKV